MSCSCASHIKMRQPLCSSFTIIEMYLVCCNLLLCYLCCLLCLNEFPFFSFLPLFPSSLKLSPLFHSSCHTTAPYFSLSLLFHFQGIPGEPGKRGKMGRPVKFCLNILYRQSFKVWWICSWVKLAANASCVSSVCLWHAESLKNIPHPSSLACQSPL